MMPLSICRRGRGIVADDSVAQINQGDPFIAPQPIFPMCQQRVGGGDFCALWRAFGVAGATRRSAREALLAACGVGGNLQESGATTASAARRRGRVGMPVRALAALQETRA